MLVTKQQLLPKRLSHFNDKPERYLSWKYSFLSIMGEIKASTLEQLDLLLNHLGPESKSQAENIRASNPRAPEKAIVDIWKRLDREYGSAETIEIALKQRIASFPPLIETDRKRFFDFSDLAAEVESVKCDPVFTPSFAYYDTSGGINDFVRKLPKRLRERWAVDCDRYKERNNVPQAPFSLFTKFLRDTARVKNDPSFAFESSDGNQTSTQAKTNSIVRNPARNTDRLRNISIRKTGVEPTNSNPDVQCPIHGTDSNHELRDCRKLLRKSFRERKDFLFKNGYCLRCCGSKRHLRKNCKETLKCRTCDSTDHATVLHPEPRKEYEGERNKETVVESNCTEVCDTQQSTSKSCAKIVLVKVFHQDMSSRTRDIYCMIDDQSNRSLATSAFFNEFLENGPETEYILSSCAGKFTTSGRKASGYLVQSFDGACTIKLPCLIECNDLPNNRNEIPSQSVALGFQHLNDIASYIPPVKDDINIELLIGRDIISAHHVLDQRVGQDGLPYGQKLPLGWVIIGEVCLDKVHQPEVVSVYRTSVLIDGRPSHLQPCDNNFHVKEDIIFRRTSDDEKPGLSIEDNMFLDIMDKGFEKTALGNWQAPLPFRTNRCSLPDNRPLAMRRAKSFDVNLKCNPVKKKQVVEFMQKLLNKSHAELAPSIPASLERWYLPMFAVYHPKKPDNVRVVFDSSARYQDASLNSVLLQGPDLCNSLLGILLRFRRERVAITMDVEQMFHNFKVPDDQRRYLRFLWHQNNDINLPLVDYQMTVHVFGNTTSPAVATYGFRKAVEHADEEVKGLINKNFYVDDGLLSCSSEEAAVDLVLCAKRTLQENGNIRLHKFASNSRNALTAFKQEDLAKNLKDLDLGTENLPVQRSLGLLWDTNEKHPIILPKNHHVSRLILKHFHQKVFHQGRNFTAGALRSAGYWLVGSKRMISSEISKCVVCRKLRSKPHWQHMDDLPEERCTPAPPFSYVGVDTFGPWPVVFRRTRGGSANHKRWALLFTCLVTRAIHIEIIEELSSSAFINALRRFTAIRGAVVQFRSDRGTNFVGAVDDLSINAEFVERAPVAKYLSDSRTVWKFNPPHAPHMGGAWERLIGTAKRILNAMLLQNRCKDLTHDVLNTLMAEVCAIVNNRPLMDVSSDPDSPSVLTPAMLLTLKTKQDVNPFPLFGSKDAFKSAWKQVQVLADEFWRKWRSEYLQGLQVRRKWQGHTRDLKVGDCVLVKDDECSRNDWPKGIIERTFVSSDGHVRKVEVAIFKDNKRVVYTRPITELVLLLEVD